MSKQPAARKVTWVIVADEHVARFLELPEQGNLVEVERLTDDDARSTSAELRNDAQGRRSPSVSGGIGGAPTLGTGTVTAPAGESEMHKEADTFARQVTERLLECFRAHRFSALRIVAAPRFLGLLRARADPAVVATITNELDKDLTYDQLDSLTRRLFPEHDGPRRKLEPGAAAAVRSGNRDIQP